jgi:hypothetical protein
MRALAARAHTASACASVTDHAVGTSSWNVAATSHVIRHARVERVMG